ncbi:MAG: hypothetical protein AAF436_06980 [Myxococcota bacterium]
MSADQTLDWCTQSVAVRQLTDRAILEVTGDDAATWLQGQVTNQLEGAASGDAVYGFVLTLKGRVLADVWVLAHDDGFWLEVPAAQVEALIERLDRYIIMEDVDLAHRGDLRIIAGVGPVASQVRPGGWPADRLGSGGRVWVLPEAAEADAWEEATQAAASLQGGPATDDGWASAHIQLGRPRFGVDFGEDTYPQETGLTASAVSFNKGCYIGQETVVMLQNRGKAPKTLWRWTIDGDEAPEPGATITRGDAAAGTVTSLTRAGGQTAALGYLKRGHEPTSDGPWKVGGLPASLVGPVGEAPTAPAA